MEILEQIGEDQKGMFDFIKHEGPKQHITNLYKKFDLDRSQSLYQKLSFVSSPIVELINEML